MVWLQIEDMFLCVVLEIESRFSFLLEKCSSKNYTLWKDDVINWIIIHCCIILILIPPLVLASCAYFFRVQQASGCLKNYWLDEQRSWTALKPLFGSPDIRKLVGVKRINSNRSRLLSIKTFYNISLGVLKYYTVLIRIEVLDNMELKLDDRNQGI